MRTSIILIALIGISTIFACLDLVLAQKRHRAGQGSHRKEDVDADEEGHSYRRVVQGRRPPQLGRRSMTNGRGEYNLPYNTRPILRPTTPRRRRLSRLHRGKPLKQKMDLWLNAIDENIPEEPFTCGRYRRKDMYGQYIDPLLVPRNRSKRYVINGDPALPYEFPYFLKLVVYQNDETYYYCGAVLISRKYALTSNNCFYEEEKGGLRISNIELHSTRLLEDWDNESVRVLRVGRVCPMPLPYEDMAVLRLVEPIAEFTKSLLPICLPARPFPSNKHAFVVGFGYNESSTRKPELDDPANKLHSIITNQVECPRDSQPEESCFRPEIPSAELILPRLLYGKACSGDLGGPIVRVWPENDALVGLILGSWPPCEEAEGIKGTIFSLDLYKMGQKLDNYINSC